MSTIAHKPSHVSLKFFLVLCVLCCALGGGVVVVLAQEGTSQAAAARTRYLAEAGMIPSSREIVVEEFVNYHRHQIGRPKAGEAVALDVRWGNDRVYGSGQEAVLQVGFSTALANERQDLRPINMALVIDRSGSMADLDKISRVKEALIELVTELRETDILSIVVFDSDAQVLLPARPLGDKEYVRRLIRSIEPGSSTNLHAGLMLGYHEALKFYRRDATNRVLLLTDGIANQGVTDPAQIASNSLIFNDRGIDLSTIGVGLDLNKDLLRQLAKSGRGLFHFVADDEDIKKVFVKEVQSLVSPVASEPNVEITYDSSLELAQVYGYEPRLRSGAVAIKLDNMNQGLTQVILLRFRMGRRLPLNARLPVTVRFTYYDLERKRQVTRTEESFLEVTEEARGSMLKDTEVGKNYTIAVLAQAIRDMALEFEARHFQQAENRLTGALSEAYYRYPHLEDEDIARNVMIVRKYQDVLRRYNQQWDPRNNR
jgi:Ca-activated chloride channel family protein